MSEAASVTARDMPAPLRRLAEQAGVRPDSMARALDWQVERWSGQDQDPLPLPFRQWLDADPDHQRAWQHVQRLEHSLGQLPAPAARQALAGTADPGRRRLLQGLLLAGGLVALAGGARHTRVVRHTLADVSTGIGQQQHLKLPDGSRLSLNTGSAVDLSSTRRTLRLHRDSEILLHASPRSDQPFRVALPGGRLQLQGGPLLLRDRGSRVQLALFGGQLLVEPSVGASQRLEPGTQTWLDQDGLHDRHPATPQLLAWSRGLLQARDQRLDEFLVELGRYRHGLLRCDPRVAGLRLTGTFPLRDTDHVLTSLTQALPVTLQTRTRYLVTVVPA